MNKKLRLVCAGLGAFFLASCGRSENLGLDLSFKTRSPELSKSPATWLWHFDGSIDDLRKEHGLSKEDMFYMGYKFAEIGNYRRFEEALLYTINNTDSIIADLSARALIEYWQSNRLFEQIMTYSTDWQKRFTHPIFELALAEAYYWQQNNAEAWEIFEKFARDPKNQLTDEHLLFRTVLALRLGKAREGQVLFKELVTQIPASALHDRLWKYLLLSPEEAKILPADELAWLEFKSLILERKTADALALVTKFAKGSSKDWLLNTGLISDFIGLYSKQTSPAGMLFLSENYPDNSSVYLSQARASFLVKQEKWEEALPEYQIGLEGAIGKPLDRVTSYYYAYLRALSLISVEKFVAGLPDVSEEFLKSSRFTRLYDVYLNEIVELRDWEGVYNLYLGSRDVLPVNYQSRLDFLMARLIEHRMITIVGNADEQKAYFYDLAMKTDPLSYGSFMAHYFTGKKISDILPMSDNTPTWEIDEDINRVIAGFLEFGLATDAYRLLRDKSDVVSPENYLHLSELLGYQEQWYNSIEVMTRLASRKNWHLTKEELKALYPQPYVANIRYWSANFDVSVPVRIGQIHDESRFDPKIRSHAGAVGISQLKEGTAQTIARELNVYRYSITNPEDNIRFGTYYLAKRFKQYKSGFKALLAYNAGYVRLNEWEEAMSDLPDELYIEAVPFWESRRYIRSIILNAGIYALIYGDETEFREQVVERIFEF